MIHVLKTSALACLLVLATSAKAADLFGNLNATISRAVKINAALVEVQASGIANPVLNQIALPSSNGVPTITQPVNSGVLAVAASNLSADQTSSERTAIATSLRKQIKALSVELQKRVAITPQTPELQTEISAINDALTSKRGALAAADGTSSSLTKAAAESYAATANPYFLMCKGEFWAPNDTIRWIDKISKIKPKLTSIGRSVGLIMVEDRPAGSGVVVGPSHVLTNRHVAELFASYDKSTKRWEINITTSVVFDQEFTLGKSSSCENPNPPSTVFVNAVFPSPENGDDLAILLVSSSGALPPLLSFTDRNDQDYVGNMTVAVIGYPGPPSDMTVAEQIEFFHTPTTSIPQFPYKRLSEGFVGNSAISSDGYFTHKANTSGGNSGSPVIDMENGQLVGLHVQGIDRFRSALGSNQGLISTRVNLALKNAGVLK